MRIAGAQSAEQSGIRGVKRPFDPNIMTLLSVTIYFSYKNLSGSVTLKSTARSRKFCGVIV